MFEAVERGGTDQLVVGSGYEVGYIGRYLAPDCASVEYGDGWGSSFVDGMNSISGEGGIYADVCVRRKRRGRKP